MPQKRIIMMSTIIKFFRDYRSQLKKGEYIYENGQVVQASFEADNQNVILKGEVRSSLTNRCYSSEITVDVDDGIVAASCTCTIPQLMCHHMVAVCLYSHHNLSVTDNACGWNKPNEQETEEKILSFRDIYPPSKPNYRAVQTLPTESEIQTFFDSLDEEIKKYKNVLKSE